MNDAVLISRVVLKNYKSIAACSVPLRSLVFLVGPNGSGKSNFMDALRFVSEALNTSLDHALRDRGGINEVRRRSSGHPTHFGIRLDFILPNSTTGHYAFQIGAKPRGGFEVQREECRIYGLPDDQFYVVESGQVKDSNPKLLPPATDDRLFLVAASSVPEFRPLYDCLTRFGFYNLNPDEIRDLQPPDAGQVLLRDGRNLASVLNLISSQSPEAKAKVVELLSKVVPGVVDVSTRHVGKKETLEFRQKVGENKTPWRFLAENMSDGTLRALGVLTALFQSFNGGALKRVPLVGIEEPEVALHPGAAGVLRDGLKAASHHTQVLVTSHSPDLLDDKSISDQNLLAVTNRNGDTLIGPVDAAGRAAIQDQLYTAGELLRLSQLIPDEHEVGNTPTVQLELFGKGPA
ncbi:MAG TPA: AAA family ATPase [Verrucomicrobiota bacterium]|nr:AAA family ATPase [Verrucomicrobiota bacterium]HRT08135.1 AAA family ATPase [Candidatus Paceibacterota bacterium]HRT58007.1 AAA family ATPase [Candidatus Paceibacterota bacterium]